ncbi:hypothetical protein Ddc_22701 [Ditylenchus destructor]|nr:hypothetical protein Ddc_22701 [Ditylenchus destructor]
MVKDLIAKLEVWKAIVDCYVECATRQENGVLKMDYKKWRQEHLTDMNDELAAGYIEILPLEDKNHIGKKLADHFEIVMQYVGGILERMKVCFKDEKDLTSAFMLNNVAMPKFNELSPKQATIVAKMRE